MGPAPPLTSPFSRFNALSSSENQGVALKPEFFTKFSSSKKVRKVHLLSMILPLLSKAVAQLLFILRYPFLEGTIFERLPFFTFNQNV